MRIGFTRGLLIGGLIGASLSMLSNPDGVKSRKNRRVMKAGRNLLRKSGNVVEDVVDLFR
jgi:gas vesicle protein